MAVLIVVDDDAREVDRYERAASFIGADVQWCGSAQEALSLADSVLEEAVLAIVLWEMSGQAPGTFYGDCVIQNFRSLRADLPVIVLTKSFGLAVGHDAREAGAVDIVSKPFDVERLGVRLQTALEKDARTPRLMMELRDRLVGSSPSFLRMLKDVAKAIERDSREVLLIGDTGTGKELIARAIHELDAEVKGEWVPANMNPETGRELVEDMLFGHEKGAFTGASEQRKGCFDQAEDGTLFLDEIGDMELPLQGKLLRVIQERQFHRIGGNEAIDFKGKLVFATNKALVDCVREGTFRNDLYYRIRGVTIEVPTLKTRDKDKELLFWHFVDKHPVRPEVAPEVLELVRQYDFPGNVRQLENAVNSALAMCENGVVRTIDFLRGLDRDAGDSDEGRGTAPSLATSTENSGIQNETASPPTPDHDLRPEGSPGGFADDVAGLLRDKTGRIRHKDLLEEAERALDRALLPRLLEAAHHNISQAARDAGWSAKTFRKHWEDAGLDPLNSRNEGEDRNGGE